jgi:hypothetical protein
VVAEETLEGRRELLLLEWGLDRKAHVATKNAHLLRALRLGCLLSLALGYIRIVVKGEA